MIWTKMIWGNQTRHYFSNKTKYNILLKQSRSSYRVHYSAAVFLYSVQRIYLLWDTVGWFWVLWASFFCLICLSVLSNLFIYPVYYQAYEYTPNGSNHPAYNSCHVSWTVWNRERVLIELPTNQTSTSATTNTVHLWHVLTCFHKAS